MPLEHGGTICGVSPHAPQGISSLDPVADGVDLLNKRLIGTPVSELIEKMEALKPVLSEHIINHDVIYQAISAYIDRIEEYNEDVKVAILMKGKEEGVWKIYGEDKRCTESLGECPGF